MSAKIQREKSFFVALTEGERRGLLSVFYTFILIVGVYAFIADRATMILVYLSFVLYVLALMFPLLSGAFRYKGIFHPIVFYAVWSGLRSLLTGKAVLAANGLESHRALIGLSGDALDFIVVQSFFLETLAVIALYSGYALKPTLWLPSLAVENPGRLSLKALIWLLLPVGAVAILADKTGGLGQLMLQRGIASDQRIGAQIGGHWAFFASAGEIVPIVWLALDKYGTKKIIFWAATVIGLGCTFAATGSRGSVIFPLIMVGAMWVMQHKKIPYMVILMGIFISLFLIGALGEFRVATRGVKSIAEIEYQADTISSIKKGFEEIQRGATYNNGQLAILGSVPREVGHLYGESYLSIPFIFIPDAIWPGEPPDAAGKLNATRIYGNPRTGIPAGLVGEAYWNFSWLGPILIFGLYGMGLSLAEQIFLKNQGNALIAVIYLYVLFLFAPGSNELYNFFQTLAPAIFFYIFVVWTRKVLF
ncbi:MAG: O-antigen polymerase [Desulfobacterales bacterium]